MNRADNIGRPNIGALLNAQAESVNRGGGQFVAAAPMWGGGRPRPRAPANVTMQPAGPPRQHNYGGREDDEDSEDEVTLASIIEEKPKPKVVREFMRENLKAIQADDEEAFA